MKTLLLLVAASVLATNSMADDKPAKPPQAPPVRTTTVTKTTTTTAPAVTYKWVCDGNKCWKVAVDTSNQASGSVGCATCQTVQTKETVSSGRLFDGKIKNFFSRFRLFGGGCNCDGCNCN